MFMTDIGDIMKNASGLSLETAVLDNIFLDAAKDLVKDEVKKHIKNKIENDPELKAELTRAVKMYMEAKVQEFYAGLKLTKAASELGYNLIPGDIRESMGKEIKDMFEKNVLEIIENSL